MQFQRATFALLPKSFRRLKRLVGHHLPVFTTIFDHSARQVITGSDDHLIKIWCMETGYLQHTLRGHDRDIIEIVKHPTLPIIISASSDTTLRVWDVDTGAALHVLDGGSKEVNAVQFSPCPDRPYVVSGGADGSVRLWNADDFDAGFLRIPIPTPCISRHATDTRHAAIAVATSHAAPQSPFSDVPQAPIPSVSLLRTAQLRSNTAPSSSPPPAPHPSPESGRAHPAANSMVSSTPIYEVLSVCFNAGATRLAVSGTDCVAHVYAIEQPESPDSPFPQIRWLTSLKGHSEHIIQVLFSRSGGSIVTACRDGTARIWNRTKARLPGVRKKKQSVAGMGSWSSIVLDCRSQIQADARSLLSGGASGSACGSIVPRMRRASFPVSVCAAVWSLNDKYLFTASSDTKIRVWHGATGQLARVLEAHEREVYVMDCHPTDERILLSAGYDGKCILWDIETGKALRIFSISDNLRREGPGIRRAISPSPCIADGQFSCDGLSFIVSDTSGAINLFGVGSGEATALAPEEQFFSRDCAPFRRDTQSRAVDENTNQLLHLVPKGRLCDRELRPHPPELQPNLPFSCGKRGIISEKHREQNVAKSGSSPNIEQNRNRDALLQRAKEFRENQEKEDRLLLREARNARRRMIIEKKKFLERTNGPFYIPLRDFEVPDSDYEDSDEDFDGEAQSSGESRSSSSSEEEDEIQPNRSRSADRHSRLGESRSRSGLFNVERGRSSSLRRLRRLGDEQMNTIESGDSDVVEGEESPGYEACSQDSESDNSDMSDGKRNTGTVNVRPETKETKECVVADREGSLGVRSKSDQLKEASASEKFSARPRRTGFPTSRLTGASIHQGQRRMKIYISTKESGDKPLHSGSSGIDARGVGDSESKDLPVDSFPVQNTAVAAHSVVSQECRGHSYDAGGMGEANTPGNPSFTSERKDNGDRASRPTLQQIEDHVEDTASFVHPMRQMEETGNPSLEVESVHQLPYSAERSPRTEKGVNVQMDSEKNPDLSKAVDALSKVDSKTDCHEKSVLSDSPGRDSHRKWHTRTRNSSTRGEVPSNVDLVVDIDEVADRELEILDAQRNRRNKNKRKKRSRYHNSEAEHASDDIEKIHDTPKRQRRRSRRANGLMLAKSKHVEEPEDGRRALEASAWLRSASTRYTYVPQLGDDVLYFPEGHVAAMKVSRSIGLEPLMDRTHYRNIGKEVLDGSTFGKDSKPLRFLIIDMSYEFPVVVNSGKPRSIGSKGKASHDASGSMFKTIMVLTLRLISEPGRGTGHNDRFVLSYFPVDAPEYLVLSSRVDAALTRSWNGSDRFRILFLNERRAWQYYTGTIRNVKPTIRTVLWNSIEVEYDNESDRDKVSVDLVSPWELEPHDMFHASKDASQTMLRSSTVEPGLFPVIARELESMQHMESSWTTQLSWLDTVETLGSIDGYCKKIACPMDLNTVLVRLCTGYYRHFCSFIHDISLLKSNVVRFHGPQSEMGRLAVKVLSRIADMAERIKVQFSPTLVPLHHNQLPHNANAGTASRTIRPRPPQAEISGSIGTMSGYAAASTAGRQFPVPLTPRQTNAGFPVPSHPILDGSGMTPSPRIWGSVRGYNVSGQQNVMGGSPSMGLSLPPAVPGFMNNGTACRTVGHGSRGRGPAMRPSNGNIKRGNANLGGRGQGPSMNTGGVQQPMVSSPGSSPPFLPPHVNPGQYHQPHVGMVASSSQTNRVGQGASRRLARSGSLSHARSLARPSLPMGGTGVNFVPASDNGTGVNSRSYPTNGGLCSVLESGIGPGAGGVSLSVSHGLPYGGQTRVNRPGSTAGDGGTHSWGRSMEGAGGIFPLQASTSDSHLPMAMQGRSPSPISPSPGPGEMVNVAGGRQVSSGTVNGARPYHEHSTMSVAAAESTMSCGGSEVAMQAGTAESAEVGTERPKRMR